MDFRHPMKKVARVNHETISTTVQNSGSNHFTHDARESRPIETDRREMAMKYLRDVTVPNEMITSYLLSGWRVRRLGSSAARWRLNGNWSSSWNTTNALMLHVF